MSGTSLEASPLGPPKKKARRVAASVSQLPASDETVPMDVSPNNDLSDSKCGVRACVCSKCMSCVHSKCTVLM